MDMVAKPDMHHTLHLDHTFAVELLSPQRRLDAFGIMLNLLKIHNLTLKIKGTGTELLRSVSFDMPIDGGTAFLGESGSGKTLLGRAIVDVLPANVIRTSGKIRWGQDENLPRISMVPQIASSALPPLVSVFDMAVQIAEWSGAIDPIDYARKSLSLVGISGNSRYNRLRPFQLSGGNAQKVSVACAIATNAKMLILDEPTIGMDPVLEKDLFHVLAKVKEKVGIILTTHDILLATLLCNYGVVLKDGQVVQAAPMSSLIKSDDQYIQDLLYPAKIRTFVV